MQVPGFRQKMNDGWYQIRIAGLDVNETSLSARLHEPLTDNGKQNTYFSSLDNMMAQGNALPVLYGEMLVGSRTISQEISTRDEGGGGQVVIIGR